MTQAEVPLDLSRLHIPLAGYPFLDTGRRDSLNSALIEHFHNGVADIHQRKTFRIIYNYLDIGEISFHAAATSSGYAIRADHDPDSFAFVYLSLGRLDVRAKRKTLTCLPGKVAALLDFEQPSRISIQPHYNNVTMRFTRAAIERSLEKALGRTLPHPLRFADRIDLTQPGPKRLLAVVDQVIAMFEQDTSLPQAPLLVAQYEQLVLAAILSCLEHNAHGLLQTPAPPAPPKVVQLCEAFLEANADKPLRLGDLAELTRMSVRSVQLAFRKHRGYSPSRFLQECRLARARDMLRRTPPGTSLLAVSQACGFASQSLFCRLYRQRFGETPSQTMTKA